MVRPQGSPFQTVKQISILLKCHYKNFCMALLISWPALNFNAVLGCKVSSKYGPCLTLIWLYLLSTHQPLTCWELWQQHLSWDVTEKNVPTNHSDDPTKMKRIFWKAQLVKTFSFVWELLCQSVTSAAQRGTFRELSLNVHF